MYVCIKKLARWLRMDVLLYMLNKSIDEFTSARCLHGREHESIYCLYRPLPDLLEDICTVAMLIAQGQLIRCCSVLIPTNGARKDWIQRQRNKRAGHDYFQDVTASRYVHVDLKLTAIAENSLWHKQVSRNR